MKLKRGFQYFEVPFSDRNEYFAKIVLQEFKKFLMTIE